jgi:FkbM family methyltransferase
MTATPNTWSIQSVLDDDTVHLNVRKTLGKANRYVTPRRARIVVSHRYDRPVIFCVNNDKDRIHNVQSNGLFYEGKQLSIMAEHMPEGGTFCDVGANVGNHSLYMLLIAGAGRVVPVEPNPDAISLFSANMILNGVADRVTWRTLGYGLDEGSDDNRAIHSPKGNLGWTKLKEAGEGDDAISVRAGDDIFAGMHVDFLKMDVEGMEIAALKGLRATLERCKPTLFIEVDNKNADAFHGLMTDFNYTVVQAFDGNNVNQNFLLKSNK